ncbi:MAG TPA: hypothetical protein VNF71_10715 [Acidimicrobiales bacterium]|nr:hypothetical protein [Acidimicrobiales bacterium]
MNHDSYDDWTDTPTADPTGDAPAVQPWTDHADSELLMTFLSDFRSAARDRRPSEVSNGGVQAGMPRERGQETTSRFSAVPEEREEWLDDPYAGSERQVTPDWWLAADSRWYPPELHPDRLAESAPGPEESATPGGTDTGAEVVREPGQPAESGPAHENLVAARGRGGAWSRRLLPGRGKPSAIEGLRLAEG